MESGLDYSGLFTGVGTEVMNGISTIVPVAVPIFGAVLAIGIGVKVFNKLAKKG